MRTPQGRIPQDRIPQESRQLRFRRAGTAYQAAFEAVFAILIGVGLGYWADASFDSAPWGLLVGFAFGFGAFVLRLVRLARQMQAMEEGGGQERK